MRSAATISCHLGRSCSGLTAVFLLMAVTRTDAHELNTSYAQLYAITDTLIVRVAIDGADIGSGFGVTPASGDTLTGPELMAMSRPVAAFVEANGRLLSDGQPVDWPEPRARTDIDKEGNVFLRLQYVAPLPEAPAEVELSLDFSERFGDDHKTMVSLSRPEQPPLQAVLSRQEPSRLFVVGKKVSLWEHAVEFTALGVEHIFLGYDHIMFLLALIVVGGRLINLIKIVTSFTLAHSITLILAALEVVQLPSRLIESGIALSITYVALENFWLRRSDLRWIITFFFGLVHGFGFANVLRELGLPTKGLAVSLVTFNLGVEVGQICIVAVVFPLVLWLGRRRFQKPVVWAVSAVIFLFGVGWLIERVSGLEYMPI